MLYDARIYNLDLDERMIINQDDGRNDEINKRAILFQISSPSLLMQPVLKMRPVSTRRDLFPCVERRRPTSQTIQNTPPFYISTDFCSGNDMAPRNGYHIEIETELQRPRDFSTRPEDTYIPSSKSDLYRIPTVCGRQEPQPFLLWENNPKITNIPDFVQQELKTQRVFYN